MKSPNVLFAFMLIWQCIAIASCQSSLVFGQEALVVGPNGVVVSGGQVIRAEGGPQPPETPPGGEAPPGAPGKKEGEKPGAEKGAPPKGDKPAEDSIKRKSEPPEPPNKREFDVKPDEQGMVQFQFRNQAWPDLMRWLAEVSGMSLDWQELPNDYLNLASQKKHSLEQTRDLFNRHLLARGYTMLEFDGTIQVLKTKGINAALVPKVNPQELASLPPNRFVRVSFALNTLIATEIVTELEPLVSSNGSLKALTHTNRLEAMDTAANLVEISRILTEEQSQDAQDSLANEFELEHVRAADVREQLLQFLGLETKKKGPTSPEQQMMEMQQQQMMMQQQQQMQQQGGGAQAAGKKKSTTETYIVANVRRNSVIVHAAPDKMAIIAAFIRRVDVKNENADSLQTLQTRTQVYRLTSLDPKQLVNSLVAMDALEPTTRLEVDDKNKAIIAYASMYDHFVIKKMIERLDGSARDVEVIQLRRLRAEDVVGTIKFLMGPEEKKDDSSRRRNYFFYDPYGNNDKKENSDAFRVAANAQDNQVLIWANDSEREEVKNLLIKLGELPPEGGSTSKIRIIDANRSSETKEYLKRLQETWGKVSPTPLVLPAETEFERLDAKRLQSEAADAEKSSTKGKDKKEKENEGAEKKSPEKEVSQSDRSLRDEELVLLGIPPGKLSFATPAAQTDGDEKGKSTPEGSDDSTKPSVPVDDSKNGQAKSPISITFDARGNLVLTSDDTEALSRLEQIMIDNAPPQRGYEVFVIKHAGPSWIKWNLEDYFKEDKKKDDSDTIFRWIFDMDAPEKKSDDPQLGKKRKLKFLSDTPTNSLIVIGADEAQLKTIADLIRLWDVPEKTNKQKLRYSKLLHIEYSKAEVISDAIKDAYRDLLSTNDKAFEKEREGGGGSEGRGSEPKRNQSSDAITDGGMSYSFSGRLSLGVDKVTNSIIVSAEGDDLLTLVCDMIKELDDAAKPTGNVEIMKLDGANAQVIEKALKAWSKANNQDQKNIDPNQAQQQQNQQQQEMIQNQVNPKRGNSRR